VQQFGHIVGVVDDLPFLLDYSGDVLGGPDIACEAEGRCPAQEKLRQEKLRQEKLRQEKLRQEGLLLREPHLPSYNHSLFGNSEHLV